MVVQSLKGTEPVVSQPILAEKRIFIVEDDVTNMAVFAVVLKQSGALVVQDRWNSGTIDFISQEMPIDIILLDLMLRGGISGYDIFAELKTHPELAKIPVVAVSASDPEIEIPKAKAAGFDGFIGKPIALGSFSRQVAACINGERIWIAG